MTNGNDELLKKARNMDRDVEYRNTSDGGQDRDVNSSGDTKAIDPAGGLTPVK